MGAVVFVKVIVGFGFVVGVINCGVGFDDVCLPADLNKHVIIFSFNSAGLKGLLRRSSIPTSLIFSKISGDGEAVKAIMGTLLLSSQLRYLYTKFRNYIR